MSILRVQREALGLSVEQLAELIGCEPEYVTGVERGKRKPSPEWWSHCAGTLARA